MLGFAPLIFSIRYKLDRTAILVLVLIMLPARVTVSTSQHKPLFLITKVLSLQAMTVPVKIKSGPQVPVRDVVSN